MAKTHWKKTIDKDWIGCYVLPEEKPIVVTLISVKLQRVKVKGVEGEYKVAYFAKNEWFDKPMLLSAAVNLKRLSKLTGSPYIEDWEKLNLQVTLQQEMDKAFGGGKDWALRIAPKSPEKPVLNEGTVDWTAAINYVKGGGDPVNLRVKKVISDILFKKLEDARPKSE